MVADLQSKRLPDFETLGAAGFLRLQAIRRPFRKMITHLLPTIPRHAAEHAKSFGCPGLEYIEMMLEDVFSPATIQVDIMPYIRFVEPIKQLLQRLSIPSAAERFSKMVMCVDHREQRFINQCDPGDEL